MKCSCGHTIMIDAAVERAQKAQRRDAARSAQAAVREEEEKRREEKQRRRDEEKAAVENERAAGRERAEALRRQRNGSGQDSPGGWFLTGTPVISGLRVMRYSLGMAFCILLIVVPLVWWASSVAGGGDRFKSDNAVGATANALEQLSSIRSPIVVALWVVAIVASGGFLCVAYAAEAIWSGLESQAKKEIP